MTALGRHVNKCRVMHTQLVNAVSSVLDRLYNKNGEPFQSENLKNCKLLSALILHESKSVG